MSYFLEFYFQLSVRVRIFLLCFCYSICIAVAVATGRALPIYLAIASTLVFILLGIFFSWLLFWTINDALKRILGHLSKLTAGDLSRTIAPKRNNEISAIIRSIASLQETMKSILAQIAETSEEVAVTAEKLKTNAEQIADGTDSVVTQTNMVSVACEQMSVSAADIAENCSNAAVSSTQASATAQNGASVVLQTTSCMVRIASFVNNAARTVEELGSRSNQIGQIIGTIQDIADQTNLLALNAAIEAARAGEQGRGFAVVADEVRALAERTTSATREISEMINSIQNETRGVVSVIHEGVAEVNNGTEYSSASGESLEQILRQIKDVTVQVKEISAAAALQTTTTGEISRNIQGITADIHTSAKSAGETAQAAAMLSIRSKELKRLVGQFTF